MARLSKIVLVAALVAMLSMAPVLEARPLVEDSTAVLGATHQRQLKLFGLFAWKWCWIARIVTFGFHGCERPQPVPIVVVPKEEPKKEEPKKEDYSPSDNYYKNNGAKH